MRTDNCKRNLMDNAGPARPWNTQLQTIARSQHLALPPQLKQRHLRLPGLLRRRAHLADARSRSGSSRLP